MIKARSYGGVTFTSKSVADGLDELVHTAAMLGNYNGRERPGAAGYAGIHLHFLTVYLQFFPERRHFSYLQNLKNDVWVSCPYVHILTFPVSWGKRCTLPTKEKIVVRRLTEADARYSTTRHP
jgi:hypothetical protein